MGAGTCDKAGAEVGVEESTSHEVGSVDGGGRARSSGVGDKREKSGVFEGEEGIGKMREGLADTRETCGGKKNVEAAIVVRGGGKIKPASSMPGPRLAGEGRGQRLRQVGQGDGWDGRQSRRGHDGDHGRQRERG